MTSIKLAATEGKYLLWARSMKTVLLFEGYRGTMEDEKVYPHSWLEGYDGDDSCKTFVTKKSRIT